jgi:glycosyltransferase involved in cell wall biosynthesis
MKISVITVCHNAARTINDTHDSIRRQTYSDIEHILVDGGSTDGTLDIIGSYQDSSVTLISEPDAGIYDAMNKGIGLAGGEVVGILNADDVYANEHILEKIAEVFGNPAIEACYGDLVYVKNLDLHRIVRYWSAGPYAVGSFARGWCPPHPTFFVRKEVYDRHGCFDLHFGLAADFELMLRFLEKKRINTAYLPEIIVRMRLGGATNNSLRNILVQNKEIIMAFKKNQIYLSIPEFFAKKFWARFRQFFFKDILDGE